MKPQDRAVMMGLASVISMSAIGLSGGYVTNVGAMLALAICVGAGWFWDR